jgi:hypothetical protein
VDSVSDRRTLPQLHWRNICGNLQSNSSSTRRRVSGVRADICLLLSSEQRLIGHQSSRYLPWSPKYTSLSTTIEEKTDEFSRGMNPITHDTDPLRLLTVLNNSLRRRPTNSPSTYAEWQSSLTTSTCSSLATRNLPEQNHPAGQGLHLVESPQRVQLRPPVAVDALGLRLLCRRSIEPDNKEYVEAQTGQ